MAVFRIEKTRDYTVMANHHLRNTALSLKAKGLLSLMLSLPEDWDYTMKGLARICKDGIDSISGGIRELETHGYLVRARVRNENGQLGSIEYTILEQPKEPAQTPAPVREKPIRENPIQVNPMLDAPIQENPAQLNTKEQNKELSITQGSSPIPSSPPTPREKSRIGQDRMRERESYREIILENIDYDILTQDEKLDRDRLDELVERSLRGAAIWDEVKDRLKKNALGLSGGQQQRLCIARALAVEPAVLLMDEPTSALDPISTSRIEELTMELKERYTIVIVTHNMQQAVRISDHTAFFLLGELVEYGATEQVFSAPAEKRTEDYITGRFG